MHIDWKTASGVVLQSTFAVAGQLVLSQAMRRLPPIEALSPAEIGRLYRYIGATPVVWLGIALLAVSFSTLLGLLSRAPASVVVPAGATNYVMTTLLANALLHEPVPRLRWAGVALIALGVGLVLSSQKLSPRDRHAARGAETPAPAAENPSRKSPRGPL